MHGYLSAEYAHSLSEFGTPRPLPHCGGWMLDRTIPGAIDRDGMGSYPLFVCRDWTQLGRDFDELSDGLVSVALVADPFGNYSVADLDSAFDIAKPFKDHFVVDLNVPPENFVTRHHRYYARRSLRTTRVELCEQPLQYLDDWCRLYHVLVGRHALTGVKAFSRWSFIAQLQTPGLVMFRMAEGNTTIGAQLWFIQNGVGYNHLLAVDDRGYEISAAYGLYWESLQQLQVQFGGDLRWLDLGAGAGVSTDSTGGLTAFKRGWSTGTRPAWFCGRVLNRCRYDELAAGRGLQSNDYFPAYRHGEFTGGTPNNTEKLVA